MCRQVSDLEVILKSNIGIEIKDVDGTNNYWNTPAMKYASRNLKKPHIKLGFLRLNFS